jgi:polar amino acid transport system substrate-binding protein
MRVNRIRALAALTAVVFACGDGGAQPADPADPRLPDKELVIGTKEAPPFAMKQPDGSWRGISIDLWRRVAERSHLRYRFAEAESVQAWWTAPRRVRSMPPSQR